eukprot:GHVN01064338.1.p1 GENE.GHVN01064338.1~~GHVN01064338.1.p1  ORF type:complete len:114 (+),score=5.97 GHVN01064338.1:1630-1971(+)
MAAKFTILCVLVLAMSCWGQNILRKRNFEGIDTMREILLSTAAEAVSVNQALQESLRELHSLVAPRELDQLPRLLQVQPLSRDVLRQRLFSSKAPQPLRRTPAQPKSRVRYSV